MRLDPTNPNTFRRMVKEGRGYGQREDYRPWIKIQDLSSRGVSSRLMGWRTGGRLINVLSTLERDHFYATEWDPTVTDYQEQYKLDPEVTLQIAFEAGIKHPTSPKTGGIFTMTSDCLITRAINGQTVYSARALKMFADVGPLATPKKAKRLAEKLAIEREYWRRTRINGIVVDWSLATEKDFNPVLAKNVRAIHDYYFPAALQPLAPKSIEQIHAEIFPRLTEQPLSRLAGECDRRFSLPAGKCLNVAWHLIATRRWPVDMTVPLEPLKTLKLLS
jgi:hypothetical protein